MSWLNPNKKKLCAVNGSFRPFVAKKLHPVLNNNVDVDIVDVRHLLTTLRDFNESSEVASVRIKSCKKRPLSVDFISQKDEAVE